MKSLILRLSAAFIICSCSILACKNSPSADQPAGATGKTTEPKESTSQQVNKVIGESLEGIKAELRKLQPQANELSDQAQGEVEKLFSFEYRVAEFPDTLTAQELELELVSLGKERWECFQVLHINKSLKVMCRRMPKTYLRYIPRVF
jgi:peptidoglycan hydrolase CwlO-like protein